MHVGLAGIVHELPTPYAVRLTFSPDSLDMMIGRPADSGTGPRSLDPISDVAVTAKPVWQRQDRTLRQRLGAEKRSPCWRRQNGRG